MNKIVLCLLMLVFASAIKAQRVYFVYVQTEQEQPFFVKLDDKVYSSTASGYLILSKLRDSVYHFSVGFPQSKWGEQKFSVTVHGKDHGYLLKNFGEKGWGLFDLQTLAVQMAATDKTSTLQQGGSSEASAFTNVLARAADDPSLKEKPLLAIEENKPAIKKVEETKQPSLAVKTETVKAPEQTGIKAIVNTETVKTPDQKAAEDQKAAAIQPATKEAQKTEPPVVIAQPEFKSSVVTKKSESVTAEGVAVSFIDANGDLKDTIEILIPNPQPLASTQVSQVKEEKKFLEITEPVTDTIAKKQVVVEPSVKAVQKRVCKESASESDFLKLRKNMAAEKDDDDMVDEARKVFKSKCFTTTQVRNLGALFLDDLGKYKFFDMAYIFVSDIENFATLQSELKQEYYINRFKSMLQ